MEAPVTKEFSLLLKMAKGKSLHSVMHKALIFPLLLVFAGLAAPAQDSPIPITKKHSDKQYKDMVVTGNEIWVLTVDSLLTAFDKGTGESLRQKYGTLSGIVAITKDHLGRIVIAGTGKSIKAYDPSANTWTEIGGYKNGLLGLAFDSRNALYLITNKGIVETANGKTYFPDTVYNFLSKRNNEWFRQPVFLMDSKDNLWIGFGYGEWGGDLSIFDTKGKKFITSWMKSSMGIQPVKSIFENGGHIYLSTGLNHMFTSGSIIEFTGPASRIVFKSETFRKRDDDTNGALVAGEYIGPAGIDPGSNSFYFYSQNGFFRGDAGADLSKMENWKSLIRPELKWGGGQPDAVGAPMNVLKLEITGRDSFIFLSQYDGIGIYDGKRLIMVQ